MKGDLDPMHWKYTITTVLFDEIVLDFKGAWAGSDVFDSIHQTSRTCSKVLRPYLH